MLRLRGSGGAVGGDAFPSPSPAGSKRHPVQGFCWSALEMLGGSFLENALRVLLWDSRDTNLGDCPAVTISGGAGPCCCCEWADSHTLEQLFHAAGKLDPLQPHAPFVLAHGWPQPGGEADKGVNFLVWRGSVCVA